jgi:hypothetical protein
MFGGGGRQEGGGVRQKKGSDVDLGSGCSGWHFLMQPQHYAMTHSNAYSNALSVTLDANKVGSLPDTHSWL